MAGRAPEGTHWWLRGPGGAVLDPTEDQFTARGLLQPHAEGRSCGFLTRAPSARARTLLARASLEPR